MVRAENRSRPSGRRRRARQRLERPLAEKLKDLGGRGEAERDREAFPASEKETGPSAETEKEPGLRPAAIGPGRRRKVGGGYFEEQARRGQIEIAARMYLRS